MSIQSLDSFTISTIAKLLDIQSFYNFSRTCVTFKDICQKINQKRIWQKEVYAAFIDVVFDYGDSTCPRRTFRLTSYIESCLNIVQYAHGIKENITSRLAKGKHPSKVIELILVLSEALLHIDYEENSLLFFESIEHNPADGTLGDNHVSNENISGFKHIKDDFSILTLVYSYYEDEFDSEIVKRINSSSYYSLEKQLDVRMLCKDKDFHGLCSKIRKLTKLHGAPDAMIAMAFQILLGQNEKKLNYHKGDTVREITMEELSLIKSRLSTIQNKNMKHLSSKTRVLKELMQCTASFSHFVLKEELKDFIGDLIGFTKLFLICISEESLELLTENQEYTKFLMKSSYIHSGDRLFFKDPYDKIIKSRYNLFGIDQVDIVFWVDKDGEVFCTVNDLEIRAAVLDNYEDEAEEEDIEIVAEVVEIIESFIQKNFHIRRCVTHEFVLAFLNLLYFVNYPIAYEYGDYYHMTFVNDKHTSRSGRQSGMGNASGTLQK